ncbi:MAG TPA: LD-carboxypeptidase [Vicinamibacterales bacterium]|nr:LD-carboxypeptidase [Vicinamibacterales bacterium]
MPTRRTFLSGAAAGLAGLAAAADTADPRGLAQTSPAPLPLVRPGRLRPGDTVGLVNPAGATWSTIDIDIVRESFEAMGLQVKVGAHVLDRHGYFAGTDENRAADVNAMFADRSVRGVVCIRGGWGCARILPRLNYDVIRANPKVLLGYSDITALHHAIHSRTGLVTFHGPVGISEWNAFNVGWLKRVAFTGEAVTFDNDKTFDASETLVRREHRTATVTTGTARGRLLGGNLTVLTSIIGSGYLPDFRDAVLFLEDVGEAPYRIDRMLQQLALSGVLRQAKAVVWGTCSDCDPGEGFGSFTLEDVLNQHLKPLGVPAWHGAMIGHVTKQFTLPLGIEVEADAATGTIRMLAPAVS